MAVDRQGPPGTVRVAVSGTMGVSAWANVFWCMLAGGTTATQAGLDAWTSSFQTAYFNAFSIDLATSVVINQTASTLFQAPQQALHSVHSQSQPGTGTGAIVFDYAATPVLSWTTGVYWRGGKPRTYLPGLLSSYTTDGRTLTTAAKSALLSHANNFHTLVQALSATGITQTTHGFVSFVSKGVERNPHVFFPISGAQVHTRMGTQRRRLGSWTA